MYFNGILPTFIEWIDEDSDTNTYTYNKKKRRQLKKLTDITDLEMVVEDRNWNKEKFDIGQIYDDDDPLKFFGFILLYFTYYSIIVLYLII